MSILFSLKEPSGFPKSPFNISGFSTETIISGLQKKTEYIVSFVTKNGEAMSEETIVKVRTGKALYQN